MGKLFILTYDIQKIMLTSIYSVLFCDLYILSPRYPSFIDALRDIDDCLSMCFLFATFPKTKKTHVELIQLCRRLSVEFMHYVIASQSLRKVSA